MRGPARYVGGQLFTRRGASLLLVGCLPEFCVRRRAASPLRAPHSPLRAPQHQRPPGAVDRSGGEIRLETAQTPLERFAGYEIQPE